MSDDFDNLADDPLVQKLHRPDGRAPVLGGVSLKRKLGEGGMASVYLGFHSRLNILVAVKISKETSSENLEAFLREARLTVSLEHPNLVRVYDVNADPHSGLHYIVMEYVEGPTAYQLLETALQRDGRPLDQVKALQVVLSAARAMSIAHAQNIVHRDLKPDNILIRARDGVVKVTDLGLAGNWKNNEVLYGPKPGAKATTVAGTLGFVSQEVLTGGQSTPAADVYALGATLYELLTGTFPYGSFEDEEYYRRQLTTPPVDPRMHAPDIHPEVVELLYRCLHKDPQQRIPDAHMLAENIQAVLTRITPAHMSCVPGQEQATPIPNSQAPVVLCVDDDPSTLELIRQVLQSNGFRPVCFAHPLDALCNLARVNPDVALLDMQMPRVDGLLLCRLLRQTQGFEDLPVLMFSGNGDDELIAQAMAQGVADYLVKPVATRELLVRLRLLTQLRTMNREKRLLETQLLKLKRTTTPQQCNLRVGDPPSTGVHAYAGEEGLMQAT